MLLKILSLTLCTNVHLQSPASSVDTTKPLKSESEDNRKCDTPPTDESEPEKAKTVPKTEDKSLLDQVKNLIGNSKPDSQMKIDPEGKQLQIDDLIIIPNNVAATPPEGGSALQNLAKIASRYQNQKEETVSPVKKAKMEEPRPSVSTATPSSTQSLAALAAMNPLSMTPAQQQSLFAMLQPGLFGMPPKSTATPSSPGAVTPPSKSTNMSSLFSPFAMGTDPSKLGPEALKLLQMFDSTLKAAVGGAAAGSTTPTPSKSSSSPKPRNASGSSSASSPSLQSAKDRERSKITRLPFDAKRPPDLSGHASINSSSNIYTNPYADLDKAKESSTSSTSNSAPDGALDLSSGNRKRPLASSTPSGVGILNLKKESALKAAPPPPMIDLSAGPRPKNEVKVSPFSAEALLSKSSSSRPQSAASIPSKRDATPPRASPSIRASPMFSPQSQNPQSDKSRSSPWHTPVTSSSRSLVNPTKPAIPVSPVVREDKNKTDLSFQAALLGLGGGAAPAGSSTAPPVSLPLPPTSFGSNPYLALAAAGMPKTSSATPSFPASAAPSSYMDPMSAYYAALYSQSLYAGLGNPYAAAMRPPGLHSTPPQAAPPPPGAASSMDLLALHAMMNRSTNPAALQAAAAGSNPYAAAAAAAGYPPGLSGLLGYPGFPPAPSSGRKDP